MTQAKQNSKTVVNSMSNLRMKSCLSRGLALAGTIGLLGAIVPVAKAQVQITNLGASYQTGSPSTVVTTGASPASGGYTANGALTLNFGTTTSNDLYVNTFTTPSGIYNFGGLLTSIYIRRNYSDLVGISATSTTQPFATIGDRQLAFFERFNSTNIISSLAPDMEAILRSQTINRGTDNTFANQGNGSGNNNNIERVDFVTQSGIVAPLNAAQLNDIGFLVLERGGNDPVAIAPILSVDASGTPTSFGKAIVSSNWGKVGPTINYAVMRKDPTDVNWRPSDSGSQTISGIYFSLGSLGVTAGQTIYGYAVIPADSATNGVVPNTAWTSYVRTSPDTGTTGLDLMAGGGVFVTHTISGTVFSDPNGTQVQDLPGENVLFSGLYAALLDASGKVLQVQAISDGVTKVSATDLRVLPVGTYSFSGVATPPVGSPYQVVLTTTQPTVGSSNPVITLPTGYVSTGENKKDIPDGTVNTKITVSKDDFTPISGQPSSGQPVITESVRNNFGLERRPTAITTTIASQPNPGGTTSVSVPPTLFNTSTDPEDGTADKYRITSFPANATSLTITQNGVTTTYTSSNFPSTTGLTILPTELSTLKVDPIDGAIDVTIPFKAIDKAGQESINGTNGVINAIVPFTASGPSVSGTVFNDVSGNKLQDGTEPIVNGTTLGLNAVLVNSSNQVVATTSVSPTGTYNFTNVAAGTYTVLITTNTPSGTTPPAIVLPNNWVTTGENLNGTVETTPAIPDSQQSITVATTSITNVNFGIEQRPTAIGTTATSQTNPGGTASVLVPVNLFNTSTDPDTGTVTQYRITAIPANATSIEIDGIVYTAAGGNGTTIFPTGTGVTVPTAKLNTIKVDPIDGAVDVKIPFKAIDNAGKESTNTAEAIVPFTLPTTYGISGNVFNDVSGNKLKDSTEPVVDGTILGLNAVLLDSTNKVVGIAPVSNTGTYDFGKYVPGNYTILLTTTPTTLNATVPPTIVPPPNWVTTGENINGTVETTPAAPDGKIAIVLAVADSTNNNFGIEQRPTAIGKATTSQPNPGTNISVVVPETLFNTSTDPDTGTVTQYRITAFPTNATSIEIDGIVYTVAGGNGTTAFPTGTGVTIPTAKLNTIKVDPIDGVVSVSIPFKAIDNAGQESTNTADAIVPFGASLVSVSGTVFDDGNGNKLQAAGTESAVDGTALGLKAVLVSNNQVIATVAVSATGTYTFNGVVPGNYTVLITTNTPVGTTVPAIDLPSNWITTGENLNGTVENTPDSQQSIAVGSTAVTGVNFGIEQLPTAIGTSANPQPNPRNAVSVDVPPALFNTSSDPDGTVDQYRITSFPSNATSITIDGVIYTPVAGPGTTAFPSGGVTIPAAKLNTIKVDPNVDGVVTVSIPFKVIDNFGQESRNAGNAIVPFTAGNTPELILLKRITKINGAPVGKPLTGTGSIDLNQVVAQPDNPNTPRDESGDASNPKWPANYPKGAIDAGAVKSGDLIEYTIYFLSSGSDPVRNANFCDWVPKNTSFVPDTYGLGRGIQLAIGSIVNIFTTNVPDGDRGVFYSPGSILPATYPNGATYKLNCMTPVGVDGAVVVNLVNNSLAAPENQLTNATGAGTPDNSYGFVRFVSKVK